MHFLEMQRALSAVSRKEAAARLRATQATVRGLGLSVGAMRAWEGAGAAEQSVYVLEDRSGGCSSQCQGKWKQTVRGRGARKGGPGWFGVPFGGTINRAGCWTGCWERR